jgi:hypothetical protein
VLAALLAAGVVLIGVELVWGAVAEGPPAIANPCASRTPFPGGGFDATVQRIVLNGLDGAACRLHTSREELVLSLGPAGAGRRHWDEHTIETAIRAGLLRSVDDAESRGDIPAFVAPVLRRVIRDAPIGKLVEGGISLSDLLG